MAGGFLRNVTVDVKQRATEAPAALRAAAERLKAARKELRAAAAAVAEWESSRPKPRRFPVFSRFAGSDDMTAPEEFERRLAAAQEACRVAQAELEAVEAELGIEASDEDEPLLVA